MNFLYSLEYLIRVSRFYFPSWFSKLEGVYLRAVVILSNARVSCDICFNSKPFVVFVIVFVVVLDVVLCGNYLAHQTLFPVDEEHAAAHRKTTKNSLLRENFALSEDFPPEGLNRYNNNVADSDNNAGVKDYADKDATDRITWQQTHVLRGNHVSAASGCVTASPTNRTTNAKPMTIGKDYNCQDIRDINGYPATITTTQTSQANLTASGITTATSTATASILTASRMAASQDTMDQVESLSPKEGNLTTCSKLSCGSNKIKAYPSSQCMGAERMTGSCHLLPKAIASNAQIFVTSNQMLHHSNVYVSILINLNFLYSIK